MIWLGIVLYMLIFARVSGAQSDTPLALDSHQLRWSRLVFEAEKIFSSVRIEVELKPLTANAVGTELIATPGRDPLQPANPVIYHLKIDRIIEPAIGKTVNLQDRVWFNPDDTTAYQRIRVRQGQNESKKIYRYTRQGVFRLRNEPKNKQEARLAPEEWTDIRESFYAFDNTKGTGCSIVSDPAVLLYLVSTASIWQEADSVSICIFGKKQVHYLRLRREGLAALDFKYREKSLQAEVVRKGKIKAIKIVIEPLPGQPERDKPEVFAFLELKKNIVFYIDPVARIPIRVSGSIAAVGQVDLNLREVTLP